jgi:hypothetical protein
MEQTTEQMMACPLAEMKAMQEKMNANLAKTDTTLKEIRTGQERMKEEIKSNQEEMNTKIDMHQEKMGGCSSLPEGMEKGDGLLGNDRGMSGVQGANLRGQGVQSIASGAPQGRSHSEIFWSAKEVARGPASSHRPPQSAGGNDPEKLWIPEKIGHRLQRYDPPCRCGTAQET